MYPELMLIPMREELTKAGISEARNAAEGRVAGGIAQIGLRGGMGVVVEIAEAPTRLQPIVQIGGHLAIDVVDDAVLQPAGYRCDRHCTNIGYRGPRPVDTRLIRSSGRESSLRLIVERQYTADPISGSFRYNFPAVRWPADTARMRLHRESALLL